MTVEYKFYDQEGNESTEDKSVAKVTYNDNLNIKRYYVKGYGRVLYDVQNAEPQYKKRFLWKQMKVSEQAFNLYLKFLQKKHKKFLDMAQRVING